MSDRIRACVAGATGWTGKAITSAILTSDRFELSGAVARSAAGQDIGALFGVDPVGIRVAGTVQEALRAPTDVMIDYTSPGAVKDNALTALRAGVSVVIGTSGLTASDFEEIERVARETGKGVVASGNFSLTAAIATHCALLAARHLPSCEIIDYAHAGKVDMPSGTTRELAERLALVRENRLGRAKSELLGPPDARGAEIAGTPVHSVRLPSYVISFEAIFGLPDERLTIRHDSGSGAHPYVGGTLLAATSAIRTTGLVRGLDVLLFGGSESH
ncbi:MAG: 4-hydroxy-tetrahydrodipicolinate reductase [Gemmatimonadaceae bacterium]